MIRETAAPGHSADVRLFLIVGDRVLPLSQIGPRTITLRDATELPPGQANVLMVVDGREHRWTVLLPHGAVPFETEVPAEPA